MKKRIILLIILLLLTTGCTCEYNLNITGNKYSEEVIITANTSEEINNINNEWKIPVDKEEYDYLGGDPSTTATASGDTYKYNISANKLTLNYDFTRTSLNNSTAISNCYSQATIQSYKDSTIISTSDKVLCFSNYPSLTNLKINITTTKPVKNHNADKVSGNTYTWIITKNNANNKPVNMVINNGESSSSTNPSSSSSSSQTNTNKNDYTLYIFCGILLIVLLFGYFIFKKIKNNADDMDV